MTNIIKSYIGAAIEIEKSGAKIEFKKTSDFPVCDELNHNFTQNPALKAAFATLTPGRQRAYLLHFSSAKQSQTRENRIQKYLPHILGGKGMDDK